MWKRRREKERRREVSGAREKHTDNFGPSERVSDVLHSANNVCKFSQSADMI